jgi:hypothetical protein
MSLIWKILVFDEGMESADIATNDAVIFLHHQVCIKKKKGEHFSGGQKWK